MERLWKWREDGALDVGGKEHRIIADAKGRGAIFGPELSRARLIHQSLLSALNAAESFAAPSYAGAAARLGQLWDEIGASAEALREAASAASKLVDPPLDLAPFSGTMTAALVDLAGEIFDRAK